VTARPRAVLYCRVSTDQQDLRRQLLELRAFARRSGWTVVRELATVASGRANDQDLNTLRRIASRREVDHVLVWELSRLSRKGPGAVLSIVQQLEAAHVRVWSYSEPFLNAEGEQRELLLALLAWLGKLERQHISERTRSGLARRKALGVRLGRPPGSRDRRPRRRRTQRELSNTY
jgi:putative DNA-invertase from lambdoid prophage Rac